MARIRQLSIRNFRGLKSFQWTPTPGVNCLIGPGDSGKSTVLDAIDLCLGNRRNVQFTDADFFSLNISEPIIISITIGELHDATKNLEAYGMFLRGFDQATGTVRDEPEKDAETVLTLTLTVGSDLEPIWSLYSDRAAAQNLTRNLSQSDRAMIAPTRIGAGTEYNLGWRRGSILNRISETTPDASAALIKAARDARAAFGAEAEDKLGNALATVAQVAKDLGVPTGERVRAMLDVHSVSVTGGTISLHDESGVPLRDLGIGSARLLVAGLQRVAAHQSTIILIDELEYGLEPHRIIRLLTSLGAKEQVPPLQAFISTHSPVALRELSGAQLFVLRSLGDYHEVRNVGTSDEIQGTIRRFPDAFLAPSVLVCEGASEVGLIRGIDRYRSTNGAISIGALGVGLVDGGGDETFTRASAFQHLGYRVAVLRDDDKVPDPEVESRFKQEGGTIFYWRAGRALEDEIFLSVSDDAVSRLLDYAVELHGEDLISAHIKSVSGNADDLNSVQIAFIMGDISLDHRTILASAAKRKRQSWFKTVTFMERLAYDIVSPDFPNVDEAFRATLDAIFAWASDDRR